MTATAKTITTKKAAALIAAFLTIFAMLSVNATPAFAATTIGGTVTDANGTAISGATVSATSATIGGSAVTATTDGSGVFSLTGIADATDWKISFAKTGYATEYYNDKTTASAANSVTVASAAVTGINASLATEGTISGVTYNASSAILTSVSVQLYLDGVAYRSPVTSDGTTGAYSFAQLPAGSYTLGFTKTGYVTQYSGGTATLAAASAFTVNAGSTNTKNVNMVQQGVMTGTTTPGGVTVKLYKTDGTYVSTVDSAAGATGAYTLANIDPGTYYVGFSLTSYISEFWNDSANFSGSTAVTISAGATTSSISPTLVANPGSGTIDTTGATVTISGTAAEGNTLTASTSGWPTGGTVYNYQWQYNDGTWHDITDAILSSYVVKAADYNKTIRVVVIGSRIGYVASAGVNSTATASVTHAYTTAPIPTISGTAAVGQTLTAVTGTWAPVPTSFTYQWYYGGAIIPGATSSTYDVTNFVTGWPITVTVTPVKADYPTTTFARTSAPTANVGALMTVTPAPTISGTAVVGNTLTAVNGAWTPSSVAFTYQWKRGGTAISGATSSSYTLVAADLNYSISVTVVATATNYTATTVTSAGTAAVLDKLTATPTPLITGNSTVGSLLTVNPGTWAPATVTLAYQWYRNSIAIAGATATTYTLVAADDLTVITVKVTGSKSGYGDVTTTSATFQVGQQFVKTPTPTIKGNNWVGQTLTATIGTWDTGAVLTHQWLRNGVAITGATGHTYKLATADIGAKITFATTGTKAGFVTKTQTSTATAAILNGKPFTKAAQPVITGSLKVGKTLGTNNGYWSPSPTKVTYQWLRNLAPIAGATAKTYKLTSSDLGTSIRVKITVTRSGYATTSKTSRPYAVNQ